MKLRNVVFCGIAVVGLGSVSSLSNATETDSQSILKIKDVTPQNKTRSGDVDSLITNNKMRAESGSKSIWSISSAFSYNGGSIESPFAEERPNIAASTGTVTKSLIDGSVSAKYNLSAQSSLSAGVGLRWVAPLSANGPKDYNGDRFDASNPYLTYQYLYRWSGVQSALQVTPTIYTNSNLLKEGYVANLGINQNNIYDIGQTGLSLGVYVYAQAAVYNKTGPIGTPGTKGFIQDVRTDQSDYAFGVDPFIEYQLSETINLRTVANLWNYEHLRSESRATAFHWDKVYQSVGVGISIARNVFLYPNLQFLPDNIRADRTNVALNTNINFF